VSGLPAGPFGITLGCVAAGLVVMLAVTFVVAIRAGKHSVVDTAWGLGIALSAVVALVSSIGYGQPARRYTLAAAAVIWGLRLAVYIGWRNHGKPEDPRYADMLAKATGNPGLYALRSVYLLQGVLLWLACLPISAGMLERAPAGPLIMDRGLWRYTRHPNYFGDFCMWWGLFLISIGSAIELIFVVAPIVMTYILTRGSGAAMTDRRMTSSRPKYADYVARTSGFFPLPPRRHPAR
jgi:steroid 5-alpha reductase family enzyme